MRPISSERQRELDRILQAERDWKASRNPQGVQIKVIPPRNNRPGVERFSMRTACEVSGAVMPPTAGTHRSYSVAVKRLA